MVYRERSLSLYVQLYSEFLQNTAIKISTSIITFLAIYRYLAVVHFVCVKNYLKIKFVISSIIFIFIFWICFMLPYLWSYKTETYHCQDSGWYILVNIDMFIENKELRTMFNYFYAIFGFFLPVCILAFCNVRLITAVRASNRRTNLARVARQGTSTSQIHQSRMRMNITLIVIIMAFFLLVLPGELLIFIQDTLGQEKMSLSALHKALLFCNLLQALNMACNFITYCAVNSGFRRTFSRLIGKIRKSLASIISPVAGCLLSRSSRGVKPQVNSTLIELTAV